MMRRTPRFTWAVFWLGLFICPLLPAQEEATSNALFVCEVREIPSAKLPAPGDNPDETQRSGIQAASGASSRLVSLKALAAISGFSCVTKGAQGDLRIASVSSPNRSMLESNFTFVKNGRKITFEGKGAPGKSYFLGSIESKEPEKAEAVPMQTAEELSAVPSEFPNTGKKVSILVEFWELPVEPPRRS